jgi:two-component system sensor histidine kinase KdpD
VLILPKDGGTVTLAREQASDVPSEALLAAAARLWRPTTDLMAGATENEVRGWDLRLLRRGERNIAVFAIPNTQAAEGPSELLAALIDQAATALDRAQLAAVIEDARVNAKTEELREALLSSISHDLQTPLAAIIGSATSLQSFGRLKLGEAEAELIATIREEGERLHHFIGNILDLTRIRAGEIHPRLEIVELADIVNAALRRAERALAEHDVVVDLPDDLPMLHLDLFMMEQTLVNLLENAAKYSPKKGRIEITARLMDRCVALEVRDQGTGIAAGDLPNVFNQFYRAEMQDAKPAGIGLGLSICRAFIEAHHGRIEAFSEGADKGALFRVMLPATVDTIDPSSLPDE